MNDPNLTPELTPQNWKITHRAAPDNIESLGLEL